jgi:dihydroorotate dehydrogenase (fumarate)
MALLQNNGIRKDAEFFQGQCEWVGRLSPTACPGRQENCEERKMNLDTNYMGLALRNPIVVSASPLSQELDNIKRMEDAGAGAVVLFSIFEEQLEHEIEELFFFEHYGSESYPEATSYFPKPSEYRLRSEPYLDLIRKAVEEVDIPIFASINGTSDKGWIQYAEKIEQAGAHGLELNMFYIPTSPDISGSEVESRYLEVVTAVRSTVKIPVALKISPFFSSVSNMALQFEDAGVSALVLFNRFYQPDFDLEELKVVSNLDLSTAGEIRLPLLWIALLYDRLRISIAATTGVQGVPEVIKYILAGADVVMTASALLRNGIEYIDVLTKGLTDWMESREYESIGQMKGSMSQKSVDNPETFERANYIRILEGYENPYSA